MRLASCAAKDGRVDGTFPFLLSASEVQTVEHVLAVAFGTNNTHKRQTPTISAGKGP